MIYDNDNAKYLTDAQWFAMFRIISGDGDVIITMPMAKNCPVDVTYEGVHYTIHPDGRTDKQEEGE